MEANKVIVMAEAAANAALEDFHTLLIAKIVELNDTGREARVEFLQKTIASRKGSPIQSPPIIDYFIPIIPIFNSTSFYVYAPYNVGDKVIVSILERPYTEAFENNEVQEQHENARAQIGYSIISKSIPQDILTSSEEFPEDFTIYNKSSGNYIQITSSGLINIQGDVNIQGNLVVSGTGDFNDKVTSSSDVEASGISLKTHIHTGVTSGSQTSGGPQ